MVILNSTCKINSVTKYNKNRGVVNLWSCFELLDFLSVVYEVQSATAFVAQWILRESCCSFLNNSSVAFCLVNNVYYLKSFGLMFRT